MREMRKGSFYQTEMRKEGIEMKKFRVWDSEKQAYRKAGELSFNLDNQTWYFNQANYQDIVIEQSTGLLDCKGMEIFENDILEDPVATSRKMQVVFLEGCFCGKDIPDNKNPLDCLVKRLGDSSFWQVIGNIHEVTP